jgi:hypothetical protein
MYQQPQQTPQIQNGGCVSVWAEQEARNYPVARGTSVTFRDETAPFIYTKSMGFGQQDSPIFEKFKKVDDEPEEEKPTKKMETEISAIWEEINALKKRNTPNKPKNDGGN